MRGSSRFSRIATATVTMTCGLVAGAAHADDSERGASTPIEHLIVIVGENHTFDNVFGTYQPPRGQRVDNLLSKGIVNADGTAGPHFSLAAQQIGQDFHTYQN